MSKAALSYLLIAQLALATATLLPAQDSEEIAVAFRPAMGFPEAAARLEAVGGRILREGGVDSVFIVAFGDEGWSWTKIWRSGGWLALDPIVAGACAQRV